MTDKEYLKNLENGKELAKILSCIKKQGFSLSEFDKGYLLGMLNANKQQKLQI